MAIEISYTITERSAVFVKKIGMWRKGIGALLAVFAILGAAGCIKSTPDGEPFETPTVLTHVFDGTPLVSERSEEYIYGYYGISDGALQFRLSSRESSGTQGTDDYHWRRAHISTA